MASITNKTKRDITLPSRHVVPKMGSLDNLLNETIKSTDNWPMINGLALAGDIEVILDAEDVNFDGQMVKPEAPQVLERLTPIVEGFEPEPKVVDQKTVSKPDAKTQQA